MSDSVWPRRRQPTRLRRPWDSPGKNTGVGCPFLLQCMKVKSESEVAQSCLTLRKPVGCSLPVSSVHGFSRQKDWSGVPLPPPLYLLPTPFSLLHCLYQHLSISYFQTGRPTSVSVFQYMSLKYLGVCVQGLLRLYAIEGVQVFKHLCS